MDAKIIDVAAGPGNVAYYLKPKGFNNIDGLDPSQGLLDQGLKKGLFNKIFCCYVTPDSKTPIEDNTYDAMLCSAGMFPGSIVPQAFKEFFLSCDKIFEEHTKSGDWEPIVWKKKDENMLF